MIKTDKILFIVQRYRQAVGKQGSWKAGKLEIWEAEKQSGWEAEGLGGLKAWRLKMVFEVVLKLLLSFQASQTPASSLLASSILTD